MPNLNKIRGRGAGHVGGRSSAASGPPNGSSGVQRPSNYGLSRHHNSDPRLQANGRTNNPSGRGYYGRPSYAGQPPTRGSEMTSQTTGMRPPTNQPKLSAGSRIARPAGSGIPRPGGSRLPGPARSGIPKPSTSQPGSRASSVGPRRPSAANDYYY